jgi:hypothetical protein
LEQPSSGPIGNIVNSAYANLNVPTRGVRGTGRGNLGCGAGTAIMFYRATGYSLAGNTKVCLSTQTIYDELESNMFLNSDYHKFAQSISGIYGDISNAVIFYKWWMINNGMWENNIALPTEWE